ncbi:DHH family phosphoesterase [Dysosmobacter sp.]|uniref:DHH family phosphoesterase n=1 Tax=Dysosmobacter sp. TaxID=2591382 RepID=UPI003A93E7B3
MERPILSARGAAGYLEALDNVLLLTHVRPDGDTIGSAAALCRALRDCGQTAYLLPNPEITATYAPYAAPYWAPEGWQAEHIVSVDIADASLLPENAQPYRDRIELAIDHHPSQTFFARNTCLEADSAACGEIVYEIIQHLTALTADIALPLYVAVSTDCGGFQYGNTTARTHRIAAALMDVVDVAAVNKALFRTKSRVRLAMESRMVADMKLFDHQRVVVMEIPLSLRQEMQATDADIEELSALPALVEGTDCGVTLRELRPGTVKVSVRTGPRVDACALCRILGGGGHHAASGATVEGTLDEARMAVLAAYRKVIGA